MGFCAEPDVMEIKDPVKTADLHIHSCYSRCSCNKPKKILDAAIRTGLSVIAVTDHNTIRGAVEVARLAGNDERIVVVIGSEILTDRGDLIGLFLQDDISSVRFAEVADEIHDQGGLTLLPHPFDGNRRTACSPTKNDAKLLDAIEIENGRYASDIPGQRAWEYAQAHHIPAVGNSDAHFIHEIGSIRTCFSGDDIREAILANQVRICGTRPSRIGLPVSKLLHHVRRQV